MVRSYQCERNLRIIIFYNEEKYIKTYYCWKQEHPWIIHVIKPARKNSFPLIISLTHNKLDQSTLHNKMKGNHREMKKEIGNK